MRVATLQLDLAGDPVAGAERCEGVDLLVLPECAFGGMPADGQAAGEVAMTASEVVAACAAFPPATTVVAGFTERAASGLLHSSAAVLRDGRLLGVSRKLYPREPFFSPGHDLPLHHVGEVAFGVLICNDANFVEPARLLALAGARVLVCPLNNDLPVEVSRRWATRTRSTLVARAVENDCWVIAADVRGRAGEREGGAATRIVGPDGGLIAAPGADEQGLVVADIDVTGASMLQRWDAAQNPAIFARWRA